MQTTNVRPIQAQPVAAGGPPTSGSGTGGQRPIKLMPKKPQPNAAIVLGLLSFGISICMNIAILSFYGSMARKQADTIQALSDKIDKMPVPVPVGSPITKADIQAFFKGMTEIQSSVDSLREEAKIYQQGINARFDRWDNPKGRR